MKTEICWNCNMSRENSCPPPLCFAGQWGPSFGEDVSGDYPEILFMLMMCFNVVSYLLYRNPRRILDLVV